MTPDIRKDFVRVAPDVVRKAAQFPPAILADVQGRRGTMHGRIAALSLAKPGDVLVIDGKTDLTCALMGSLMTNVAKEIGLGGLIIDGAVRDVDELRALGFPVFAAGTNPNGPTKFVPGRINWPIAIGGVAVAPGDLIVGDVDGVVVIERERAPGLLDAAAKKVADEQKRMADIRAKRNLEPDFLLGALRAAGLLKEGEKL